MSRPQRIHVVVVLAIGLSSLLIAFVSGPLMAVSFMSSAENSLASGDNTAQIKEGIDAMFRFADVSATVSIVWFLIALMCFVYCFAVWAASFIGPRDETSAMPATQPESPRP